MEKNNGGAKPKTGNGSNNNNSNNRQAGGAGTSQVTGAQARNRSPRRENGYASRSNGGTGARGLRSNYRGTGPITASSNVSSNTATPSPSNSTPAASNDTETNRRSSVPTSMARSRYSYANQTRASNNNIPQRYNDYSPLRGQGRSTTRQSTGAGTSSYSRPVMRHRNLGTRGHPVSGNIPPLEGPDGDLDPFHSLSAPASSAELNANDPDSGSCSPTSSSPRGSPALPPPRSASLNQLSARQERPMSTSRDALLARELLQSEMDMMLQQDEEMARQIHEEMNGPQPSGGLALQRGMPFRQHYPAAQTRHEMGGRRPQGPGRDRGFLRNLRLLRDPDGTIRMGFDPRGRRGSDFHPTPRAGGRRASEPSSEASSESHAEPVSLDDDADANIFERGIMGGDLDPPDDFLNMMNDPSLMLLMLLLRAPDPLSTEGGVDLEDYEGLWELAERIGDVRHRGISEDQIGQLPTHKFKPQSEASEAAASTGVGSLQCQICLVDFENGDCLRCIPCKHDFHKDCIDEWLKRNATCPICRQGVKPGEG